MNKLITFYMGTFLIHFGMFLMFYPEKDNWWYIPLCLILGIIVNLIFGGYRYRGEKR